jgi:hypothetical protein
MKKTWIVVGMAALFLTVGAVLSAKAEGTGCPMKGKKDKASCCAGMDLKQCKFTEKPTGKDDMSCWVCPMKDSMSDKPGKCPKCGMELKKMYCGKYCKAMKKADAMKSPNMSGKGEWSKKGDAGAGRSLKPEGETTK